jgi:hypothetical protein
MATEKTPNKEELEKELTELGANTEGTKPELEERLEDVRVEQHLEPDVYEGRADALKANKKYADSNEHQEVVNPTADVYEARKVD